MVNPIEKTLIFFCLLHVVFSQQLNLSNSQLDLLKKQIQDNSQDSSQDNSEKIEEESIPLQSVIISPKDVESSPKDVESSSEENFGYSYFNQEINFFDNIPAPPEFKLGPGDEIILSMWGETNSREKFIINREGQIFYKSIGFINLNNKTIEEAETILSERLSVIFSTINNDKNSTQLMLEIGKLKSVNVYVSGETKNPGINLIHPFSDVFTALNQVGVNQSGSLRNIELIRDGNPIYTFDFYEFFINGKNNFSNIRILDGDIIHIPVVKKRVQIKGAINRPKYYELLNTDSLDHLISYAGGLTAASSDKIIIKDVIPIEKRKTAEDINADSFINLSLASRTFPSNGALINVLPVGNYDKSVMVYGKVVFPGEYPAYSSTLHEGKLVERISSLKEVLDLAGGFVDPIFRKSINTQITILRLDQNNFYGKEITVDYKDSANFNLEINDQILVYENPDYSNVITYSIAGEVNRPGTYPLNKGRTLRDAIQLAGGLSELGSNKGIAIQKEIQFFNNLGELSFKSELVRNVDLDFEIGDKDKITVLPITNVINVNGNVYTPGLVALPGSKSLSIHEAIELAGGYKPHSLKNKTYVVRSNGEIDKVNLLRGRAQRVFPGDSVFVPLNPDPQDFDISLFIAELSTTLTNIVALLILIENNTN